MRVEDGRTTTANKDVCIDTLEYGFYMGKIGIYAGLFLVTYDGAVFVTSPNLTWSKASTFNSCPQRVHGFIRIERNG